METPDPELVTAANSQTVHQVCIGALPVHFGNLSAILGLPEGHEIVGFAAPGDDQPSLLLYVVGPDMPMLEFPDGGHPDPAKIQQVSLSYQPQAGVRTHWEHMGPVDGHTGQPLARAFQAPASAADVRALTVAISTLMQQMAKLSQPASDIMAGPGDIRIDVPRQYRVSDEIRVDRD